MGRIKKSLPVISIVGRPNVGKSSLFNRIIGKKHSIVDKIRGVTRDRLKCEVFEYEKNFVLIDTGGIVLGDDDFFQKKIIEQVDCAIEESSAIIFLLDGSEDFTGLDQDIADKLRKSGKKIFVAINKMDNEEMDLDLGDYYKLGFENVYPISAIHDRNVLDLLNDIFVEFPDVKAEKQENYLKIAVVGRPNVGKSSFINKLLNEERVIVSDIPGTTRDAVDVSFIRHGKPYVFIDTAGMKYDRKIKKRLEFYSLNRAEKSIKRADVVVMLIESTEGLTTLELKILEKVSNFKKPCILGVNKWDLLTGIHQKDYLKSSMDRMIVYPYVPIVFISAKEGINIHKVFDMIELVNKEREKRITTGVLNRFFSKVMEDKPPALRKGKRFKIYYISQVETYSPTFLISANDKSLLDDSYRKYLERKLREQFGFVGLPVNFYIR